MFCSKCNLEMVGLVPDKCPACSEPTKVTVVEEGKPVEIKLRNGVYINSMVIASVGQLEVLPGKDITPPDQVGKVKVLGRPKLRLTVTFESCPTDL